MFHSAQEALRFAYRTVNTPIVKMSSINSMRGGSATSDMNPHDRHAQAAMILSIVEKAVDVNGLAYFKAHYGNELGGGEHERAVADILVRAVMAGLPTGLHSRRGVEKLIRIYFGKKISVESTRYDLGCNNRKYYEYKERSGKILDLIGAKADDDAHRALEVSRLIGVVEAAA